MAHSTIDSPCYRSAGASLKDRGPAMTASVLVAAAEAVEEHRDLPMPAWAFGAIAIGVFFALFLVTWSFKSVGTKH